MHLKTDKVDLKKPFFCIFFQSTHQVVVECYKDFFGYFNALETQCGAFQLSYAVITLVVFLNTLGSLLSGCFAVLLAQQQFVSFNVSHKDKE